MKTVLQIPMTEYVGEHAPMSLKYGCVDVSNDNRKVAALSAWLDGTIEVIVYDEKEQIDKIYLIRSIDVITAVFERNGIKLPEGGGE